MSRYDATADDDFRREMIFGAQHGTCAVGPQYLPAGTRLSILSRHELLEGRRSPAVSILKRAPPRRHEDS